MTKPRKRLTYANVMSSIAVFLVLGGASAVAAKKIGSNELKSNSVTTAKLKKNAVTAAKIKKNAVTTAKLKNGAVTGAKVDLASLGTVPSASNANVANSVTGRIPFSVYAGAGTHNIATVGPFTLQGVCRINDGGDDEGELQLLTSVDGAVMDDNNGNEFTPFNVSDNPAFLYENSSTTGEIEIEIAEEPGLIAVAPDGTAIVTQNESIGFNLTGHAGQCYFGGLVQKIG
ncbi:MAG TPA: hypothetical protein VFW48_02810 [Solirubrobacterales bacterium]|nr:hypothetical protein [Solirubrobacterales bacterium]